MITLLYGDFGTGKTAHIMDMIKHDCKSGTRSFWLVPEQKAVITERNIAKHLPPSAQLYTEVLNFTRLCDKVFRQYGGLKYNYISKSAKRLVMYRTLCEIGEALKVYRTKKGKESGSVSLFLDAVGELKSYLVDADSLRTVIAKVQSPLLKDRIDDLVSVYSRYQSILSSSFSDPYDDMAMLEKKLSEHAFFENTNVYISSFNGFTGAQRRVLYQILSQAKNVTVSIDMPLGCTDKIQYAKLSETSRSIEKMCAKIGKSIKRVGFDIDLLHTKPALSYLSRSLWSFGAQPSEDSDGITLARPRDEFDECELVASEIKRLVMDGARYSDIAVIMRKTDTYRGIIDYALEKQGIPYYMSAHSDIRSKPLVKMIYSVINASFSFSARDICSYIRCGYSDISDSEANELEDYMYRWGIYGAKFENDDYFSANPDGYVTEPTTEQMERLTRINDTRSRVYGQICIIKNAFNTAKTTKDVCYAIYSLMQRLDVKGKLESEIKSAKRDEAMELSQLYNAVIGALDEIAELLPNMPINQQSFTDALSYVLDEVKLGSIPTGEDNVTVAEALTLRAESIKYAFVLGACEGEFPATVTQGSYFSDSDKIELEANGIELSARSDIRADDELFSFKNAIAIASTGLYVLCPMASIKGEIKSPSVAYTRIKALFPTAAELADSEPTERIYSEASARERLGSGGECAQAIRELLSDGSEWEGGFSNENDKITKASARQIFGDELRLSQSRISTFVGCHFRYYCSYLLGLKGADKISFGARESGVLSHAVFELLLKKLRDESRDAASLDREEINTEVKRITDEYISSLCMGAPSGKLEHLFSRLRDNISVYVQEMARELAQSDFVPEYFELPFSGRQGGVAPLSFKVEGDATITLSGVVDRVDVLRQNDTAYIKVIDYKSGEKKFSFTDFNAGLELQLLIYLFALCKMDEGKFKRELLGGASRICPAGVMYFPMKIGKATVKGAYDIDSDEAREAEEKEVASLVKRSGIFLDDEDVLLAQDKEKSGKYVPKRTKDNSEYFVSEQGFEELYTRLESTLGRIGREMLDGNAQAKPLELKGHSVACEYCEHKPMCRRREK